MAAEHAVGETTYDDSPAPYTTFGLGHGPGPCACEADGARLRLRWHRAQASFAPREVEFLVTLEVAPGDLTDGAWEVVDEATFTAARREADPAVQPPPSGALDVGGRGWMAADDLVAVHRLDATRLATLTPPEWEGARP